MVRTLQAPGSSPDAQRYQQLLDVKDRVDLFGEVVDLLHELYLDNGQLKATVAALEAQQSNNSDLERQVRGLEETVLAQGERIAALEGRDEVRQRQLDLFEEGERIAALEGRDEVRQRQLDLFEEEERASSEPREPFLAPLPVAAAPTRPGPVQDDLLDFDNDEDVQSEESTGFSTPTMSQDPWVSHDPWAGRVPAPLVLVKAKSKAKAPAPAPAQKAQPAVPFLDLLDAPAPLAGSGASSCSGRSGSGALPAKACMPVPVKAFSPMGPPPAPTRGADSSAMASAPKPKKSAPLQIQREKQMPKQTPPVPAAAADRPEQQEPPAASAVKAARPHRPNPELMNCLSMAAKAAKLKGDSPPRSVAHRQGSNGGEKNPEAIKKAPPPGIKPQASSPQPAKLRAPMLEAS